MNPFLLIAASAAATYFWRATGVLLAGNLSTQSPLFRLASCITYALVAALIARMIIYPAGAAGEEPLAFRLVAAVAGLSAFIIWRRNVAVGAWAATAVITLLNYIAD